MGDITGEGLAGEKRRGFAGAARGCAQGSTRIAGEGVRGLDKKGAAFLTVSLVPGPGGKKEDIFVRCL